MNILTDALPYAVNINGVQHHINTDFRAGIKFELMIQRGETDPQKLLKPFFREDIPGDIIETIHAIHLFYCCGSIPEKKEGQRNKKAAYSFEVDSGAIFADFMNYYRIDLTQERLHWWEFRFLLENLPPKSEFKQRVHYRICDLKGLHKTERERILKIRSQIEIKTAEGNKITLEERNKKMIEYLAKRRNETTGGEM